MSREHTIRAGESIPSLAFENGFFPATLWNHPNNAALRQKREVGTVLKEGDAVFIPDLTVKEVNKPTDAEHVFRRKGFPEKLRIRFLDDKNNPRGGRRYVLTIDGSIREGKTDGEGFLTEPIFPNAVRAKLVLYEQESEENYELQLAQLQPVTELAGVQARLSHLGYFCHGEEVLGELTRACLLAFQNDHKLEPTGEADEKTRELLKRIYGA